MNKRHKDLDKIISYICAIVFCTLAYWIIGHFFNFYYDLNDDILIKDILSGAYTGSPEAHNMQMMYPISWLLKSLYSINPTIQWMGLMELGLMWLCSVLLIARTQYIIVNHIAKKRWVAMSIVGMYLCISVFAIGTQFWELLMVQYTVVCGMLATTAAYLVFTKEDFQVNENILPIVLVVLAFNIRSEMLLLMCPFLAAVGMCKWISEGFSKESCKKYLGFVAIILCGLGITVLINSLAYKTADWKEFSRVFNARTTLYDFTGIPDYGSNEDFYSSQLADENDYDRLVDYNFVLSDRVNEQFLSSLAEYALTHNVKKKTVAYAVFEIVKDMASFKTPAGRDALTDTSSAFMEEGVKLHVPFNIIIVMLYILAVIAGLYAGEVKWAYSLPFLLIMRMVSWGYVSYKGRINARIAHPMYFCEVVILVGILLVAWAESDYRSEVARKRITALLTIAFLLSNVVNAMYIPSSIKDVKDKSAIREEYNQEVKALYSYTSSNPREYYLLDVYSTVNYTERIFDTTQFGKGNTQLAGGWMALSPLDNYKQGYYSNEYKFITSTQREELEAVDEIKNSDDTETLFYVYNVSDVK